MARFYLFLIICGIGLAGCSAATVRTLEQVAVAKVTSIPLPTPTSTTTIITKPEHEPIVDCGYSATGNAWLDTNVNGVWEDGELPLSGIRFFVDDVYNQFLRVNGVAITDETGQALIDVFVPGCPTYEFEIYTVVDPQYRLTTPERLEVDESDFETSYNFGFVIDESFARAAPIALVCESIYSTQELQIPYQFKNDTLWKIGSQSEITRISPDSVDIVARTPSFDDGRARRLEDFTLDSNNNVWIATWDGLARYNGDQWRWFGLEDGLPDTFVTGVEVTEDGWLWASTVEGLAWFEPMTERWQLYEPKNGRLDTGSYPAFVRLTSGPVWFLSGAEMYEYRPENDEGYWWEKVVDFTVDSAVLDVAYEAKGVTGEVFWLFGRYKDNHTLGYVNTLTEEQYALNASETNGAMPDDYIDGFAVESNSAVWVGFAFEGLYRFQLNEGGSGTWAQYALQHNGDLYLQDPVNDVSIVPIGIDSTSQLWVVSQKGMSRCLLPPLE